MIGNRKIHLPAHKQNAILQRQHRGLPGKLRCAVEKSGYPFGFGLVLTEPAQQVIQLAGQLLAHIAAGFVRVHRGNFDSNGNAFT